MKLMKTVVLALLAVGVLLASPMVNVRADEPAAPAVKPENVPPVLNFKMQSLDEKEVDLSRYAGKVTLIVNTASKCRRTPQYKVLQELHEKYSAQGLAVLGFPSNDFEGGEPGTNAEIGEFCEKNYGVKFDMFAKISVTGDKAAPLYKFLTNEKTNPQFSGPIKWNFEKFLIGRDGKILARFGTRVEPNAEEVIQAIEAALKAE